MYCGLHVLQFCSGGDSNLQRDNPLYESQEIRMEMFADVSDEDDGGNISLTHVLHKIINAIDYL